MKFPYKKFPAKPIAPFPDRKGILRPVISARVINPTKPEKSIRYETLIDSGADYCIFHADIGKSIGLDIKLGPEMDFYGTGGVKQKAYFHEVLLEIGGWEFNSNVGFSYDIKTLPYGILGQIEFFNFFEVRFDFPKETIELKQKN